jgi:hypothetical protein
VRLDRGCAFVDVSGICSGRVFYCLSMADTRRKYGKV